MSDDSSPKPEDAAGLPASSGDEHTYRLSAPNPMTDDVIPTPLLEPAKVETEKGLVKRPSAKSKRADYWALWGYNGLVFVTSVCVMTLELTASRLISKTVGSSLYTWTSVIGVVLAGITLGNWLGGWLADRYDRGRALAWMYLLGSVSCASVLWLDQIIAPIDRPSMFSWQVWILTVVASIFLLPSLALGTISPLVASMALSRSTKTGSTVGNVYAWGAFGSIVGTFLTGFYLIDVCGTRTIIGMTAGMLGLLAVIAAGSGKIFRASVVCGWMQLLGWTVLAATCTQSMMAEVGQSVGSILEPEPAEARKKKAAAGETDGSKPSDPQSKSKAATKRNRWSYYAGSIGQKLHELGLLLKLRDDRVGTYYDESNYSTIIVSEDENEDGTSLKSLRLDKLVHSYYDPFDPTALHYEYEQVYAAVTKATARSLVQPVTLSTRGLPQDWFDKNRLPEGVSFDENTSQLRIDQPSQAVFDALLELSPDSPFWRAITELHRVTNEPLWGGFSSVELPVMPDGVTIPESKGPTLRHDLTLGVVTAYRPVTAETRDQLIRSTPTAAWQSEIERARGLSRRATALFVGGGGYIFPRWFLKEFPGSPNIEVAELDPAVYRAVVKELGLTEAEQKRIVTTLGDARNFVDDRLRENQRLVAAGKPPVLYDFIYGDAFNDFSIPAHLTTREFLQDTHDLLATDGVYQANIIDIYPRTEFPGETVGEGEVDYKGELPKGLAGTIWTYGRFESAGRGFAPLEVKWLKSDGYRIRCARAITKEEQTRLTSVHFAEPSAKKVKKQEAAQPSPPTLGADFNITPESDTSPASLWTTAINQLATQSRRKKPFAGTIPAKLNSAGTTLEAWIPGDAPFEFVEVMRLDSDVQVPGIPSSEQEELKQKLTDLEPNNAARKYALGFRGIVSEELKQKLIDLEPKNAAWTKAIAVAAKKSHAPGAGRFLGRYVATAAKVFPNIYVFSTSNAQPDNDRDTFVMVCSRQPLDLTDLAATGEWKGRPFAAIETKSGGSEPTLSGQMSAVLALSEGHLLTDDFAPIDNLLSPVFAEQE